MKSWVVAAVLVAAMVAGCADDNSAQQESTIADAEQAAAELDVQATKTTGVIRGIVVDEALRPLAGVLIAITNMDINATSSSEGAFAFEGLEAGTYFLQASLLDYTTVQQSADVVAGVDNPDAIKILLAAVPRATPRVVALSANGFISGSGWLGPGGGTGITAGGFGVLPGNYNFNIVIEKNATVAQTEIIWNPTTPLADWFYSDGGTRDGTKAVKSTSGQGPSPLLLRANATSGDDTADNIQYRVFVSNTSAVPAGVAFNQQFSVITHVFYNIVPDSNWRFTRDGAYPVPGG